MILTGRVLPVFVAAVLGAVTIACGRGRQGPPRPADNGPNLGSLPTYRATDSLAIGDNPNTSGNSFGRGVSAQFGDAELGRLYLQLNGPTVKEKLRRYVCPSPLPSFTITVVLWYEGSYQERRVRMQMTPPLYKEDGRIEGGIGYLFEQAVKALDQGPPIDYGYRHPLDGSKAVPRPQTDSYEEPEARNCDQPGTQPSDPSSRP